MSTRPEEHPLRPMLATAGTVGTVAGEGWSYEFKWDGVRAIYAYDGFEHRIVSRRGNDVTGTYPELDALGPAIGRPVALDGEIVAFEEGTQRPSFARIQQRMNVSNPVRAATLTRSVPVALLVFDLLMLDGEMLIDRPYTERRHRLEGLGLSGPHWQVPPRGDDLRAMLQVAGDLGLEGVVAKRTDSPYRPGERSTDWRKLRLVRRQEFVVGGYHPGEGSRSGGFGSLIVGTYDDEGRLVHAGSVGSGFTDREMARLQPLLESRRRDSSPFDGPGEVPERGQIYVEPDLVVEVQFSEWTPDGNLRQPSYKGQRTDKDPRDVVRET